MHVVLLGLIVEAHLNAAKTPPTTLLTTRNAVRVEQTRAPAFLHHSPNLLSTRMTTEEAGIDYEARYRRYWQRGTSGFSGARGSVYGSGAVINIRLESAGRRSSVVGGNRRRIVVVVEVAEDGMHLEIREE
jgi:hypothetical protein